MVLDAAAVPLVALVVLVLTVARWKPAVSAPTAPPAPPAVHPLALVAESLQALPQRQLMAMAGTRRRLPKAMLTALLVAACG